MIFSSFLRGKDCRVGTRRKRGFFGSKPFSRINAYLREWGKDEIDWQLPDL